jgi:hypothetical protein
MAYSELHVLERKSQVAYGAQRVASALRAEMEARGLSAKELAYELKLWAAEDPANRWALDYRTIQNAAAGTACALDTYLPLSGYFGWDWVESIQTPIHGADPLAAREAQLARQLAQVAALQARVERDRTLRSQASIGLGRTARGSAQGGAREACEPRAFTEQAPPLRSV